MVLDDRSNKDCNIWRKHELWLQYIYIICSPVRLILIERLTYRAVVAYGNSARLTEFVIIDNRHNRQVIAIQRTAKAWSNTGDVAKILQETFNDLLCPKYRIQLSIDAKYHTHEFWEVVSSYHKGIKKVTFTFPYPNLPQISDMVGDFYRQVALETDSEPSTTLAALPRQTTVNLDQSSLLLTNMLNACAASGKPIKITPVGSKEICLGEEGLVEEKLSDAALKNLADKHDLFKTKWKIIIEFLNNIKLVYE